MRTLLWTIAAAVAASAPLHAESADAQVRGTLAEFNIRFWSEDHGLPSSFIRAIAQDREGYIWIGSGTEVVRFDGVSFETSTAMGLSRRLPNGFVTALHAGADGTMWVGFSAGEIAAIRGKTVTIYDAADGLSGRSSSSLSDDGKGGVFAAGWGGLFWFDGQRWRRQGSAQGIPEGAVLVVYKDRGDGIWTATPSTLLHKAPGEPTFSRVGSSNEANPSFAEDNDGRLWITDSVVGLRRIGGRPGEWPGASPSEFGQVVQILFDRRGDLWIATMTTGLWRRPFGADAALQAPALMPATSELGPESHPLRVVLEDSHGNLWVGTQHGLYRLTPHRVQSLATLGPVNVVENGPNGSVWVGTGSGLFHVSYDAGRWEILERRFAGMSVTALHLDRSQCLWAAVGKEVVRLDGATVRFFPPPADIALSRINALSIDADATLWVGDMSAGLLRMREGQWVAQAGFSEQNDGSVFALLNDDSGATWVGTGNRVVVMQRGGTARTHARDDIGIGVITSLFQDDVGTVWIGGTLGLARFAGDRFEVVFSGSQIPEAPIIGVADDAEGALWVSTSVGLSRLGHASSRTAGQTAETDTFTLLDTSDGAAGMPWWGGTPNVIRSRRDGSLLFATSNGLTRVAPDSLTALRMPRARIDGIEADDEAIQQTVSSVLPSNVSRIRIRYSALNLAAPTKLRFRYRLTGFDDRWVEAGTRREASYPALPAGTYRFEVAATNHDGRWSTDLAVWDFSVLRPFYQTWWFAAVCLVTTMGSGHLLWRVRTRRMQKNFTVLMSERIRISREIHDTLLQALVGVALQLKNLSNDHDSVSEATRGKLVKTRRQVEEYIREARYTIAELRDPGLTKPDLPTAVRQIGEQIVNGHDVCFELRVEGPINRCPHIDRELFVIAREAVLNAVRHASPGHVSVTLAYSPHTTTLSVADDGIGMAASAADNHYGISTMMERAEHLGGHCTISSEPGQGTEVRIAIPNVVPVESTCLS